MPAVIVTLADDERVVRVYFRYPKQVNSYRTLLAKDYARKMGTQDQQPENGISLLRIGPKFLSLQDALDYVPTIKKKGLTGCTAADLKPLGLTYMANSYSDAHFTARCPGCNLNPLPRPIVCQPVEGQTCTFDLQAVPTLTETLNQIFQIVVPIT